VRRSLLRAGAVLAVLASALPLALGAQSSIFGVRGLGLPGRPLSATSRAAGGSTQLFDAESGINPAALGQLRGVSAGFTLTPDWRHWETPAGNASLRETRFPLITIGGPVPGGRLALGVSFGSYADRDFKLTSVDTVLIRGQQVGVNDTLSSLGGLSELRGAASFALNERTSVGLAVHWITGSNRLEARRSFADSSFVSLRQRSELSYQGVGFSVGLMHQLTQDIQVAALLRSDGKATVDRDSSSAYSVDLPYTAGLGLRYRPAAGRLSLSASGVFRSWSGANSDLRAQGAPGAQNTVELSVGGEYARNNRRFSKFPLRFGIRYATLPFPVVPGSSPHEISISTGTGFRFAQDRAAIDLALEQAWRSEGSAYKERVFGLVLGLSVRPYGLAR